MTESNMKPRIKFINIRLSRGWLMLNYWRSLSPQSCLRCSRAQVQVDIEQLFASRARLPGKRVTPRVVAAQIKRSEMDALVNTGEISLSLFNFLKTLFFAFQPRPFGAVVEIGEKLLLPPINSPIPSLFFKDVFKTLNAENGKLSRKGSN